MIFLKVLAILILLCSSCSVDPGFEYQSILSDLQAKQQDLARLFKSAGTEPDRRALIQEARDLLVITVTEGLLPCWYGTKWDFNGTSQQPGQGAIACGYFVTTVLSQAGIGLDRIRLAQQPSEVMIKAITSEPFIRRYSNVPVEEFVESVEEWGEGLYVVGLDIHTGFVVNKGGKVSFVHSSYVQPYCVIEESAATSPILSASRYRVLAKISADDELILNWLEI